MKTLLIGLPCLSPLKTNVLLPTQHFLHVLPISLKLSVTQISPHVGVPARTWDVLLQGSKYPCMFPGHDSDTVPRRSSKKVTRPVLLKMGETVKRSGFFLQRQILPDPCLTATTWVP